MANTVVRVHRVLSNGSSFPSLVETSAGRQYVLKLSGAGPGRRALATEFVALEIAQHLRLNVPQAEVLELPRDLPWQTGTDEFYETMQRSAGLNLGVAFIPAAKDLGASELAGLPEEFAGRLAVVDALLQNVDRTAANPNIMRDAAGMHWAIDFGACLLLERLARGAPEPRRDLSPGHSLAGRTVALEDRLREAAGRMDSTLVDAVIGRVPVVWLDDLGVTSLMLRERLTAYLDALRGR